MVVSIQGLFGEPFDVHAVRKGFAMFYSRSLESYFSNRFCFEFTMSLMHPTTSLRFPGKIHNSTVVEFAHLAAERPYLALGLEGSANKFGAGIIKHAEDGTTSVLSNIRHTYITPPGEGFQPRDTALHHRQWALKIIKECLTETGLSIHQMDCICFTKGA